MLLKQPKITVFDPMNHGYGRSKIYIVGTLIFYFFAFFVHDIDPMTFIYQLDPYPFEIYLMCKYEPPTSRLSKVIV